MRHKQIIGVAIFTLLIFANDSHGGTSKLKINAYPEDSKIYALDTSGSKTPIGDGNRAEIKLSRKGSSKIIVEAPGFEPQKFELWRNIKYPNKTLSVQLENRLVRVTTEPSDSEIVVDDEVHGIGIAEIIVPRGKSTRVTISKNGFEPKVVTYKNSQHSEPPPLSDHIELDHRLVQLKIMNPQAKIRVNGLAINDDAVPVPKGKCVGVKIEKKGFKTEERMYCNKDHFEPPPLDETLTLYRAVSLMVTPPSSVIYVDDVEIGVAGAEIVLPEEGCVVARVEKEGFVPVERSYCTGEFLKTPSPRDHIALRDRRTTIEVAPESAQIKVQGKSLDQGESTITIRHNSCVDVTVEFDGHILQKREYCNKPDTQEPPISDYIELAEDEAYDFSRDSDDFANSTAMVEVGGMKYKDAWQTISSIVLQYFEVLEVMDKETGYIRTAWIGQRFDGSTVRTRLIVMLRDRKPIKFAVKLESEHASSDSVALTCDACFKEWDRLLRDYWGIQEELTGRLIGK